MITVVQAGTDDTWLLLTDQGETVGSFDGLDNALYQAASGGDPERVIIEDGEEQAITGDQAIRLLAQHLIYRCGDCTAEQTRPVYHLAVDVTWADVDASLNTQAGE